MKAYVIVWDKRKPLTWSNVDKIVETQSEAISNSDISGDPEAQENTPYKGYGKVSIRPL